MWEKIMELGKEMDIEPYGTEALSTLRIEMGHVAGSEIDGRTTPSDLRATNEYLKTGAVRKYDSINFSLEKAKVILETAQGPHGKT